MVSVGTRITLDSYLTKHEARDKLTGILYLQNDHSTDSFTRTHLQILQVLTQQEDLSIENAWTRVCNARAAEQQSGIAA